MPLEVYRAKRDFDATPEPSGDARGSEGNEGLLYVIQKHDASRLHYDFRLELDGVLLSWAVPKGPSVDPTDKRLAVRVEDHPVEYGGFEGIIPQGEYGGGTVELWDRGTWEPVGDPRAALQKGDLKFRLNGEKLKGSWVLVHIKPRYEKDGDNNWLLIKHRDEFAVEGDGDSVLKERPESVLSGRTIDEVAVDQKSAVHGEIPSPSDIPGAVRAELVLEPPSPQLATLVKEAPRGDTWLHEIKFDGYRTIAVVRDGTVRMFSRNGKDWSERFEPIARNLESLPVESAVIDGEVIVQLESGISDFGSLQADLSSKRTDRMRLAAFDILHLNGYDLSGATLDHRKRLLEKVIRHVPGGRVFYVDDIRGEGPAFLSQACAHGLEGIISKRIDSAYRAGSRGRDWVKVKCSSRQEFAIVGYTLPGGSRSGFGALLLGERGPDGRMRYAGRVGSGFSDRFLQDFSAKLKKIERKLPTVEVGAESAPEGATWVKPEYVGEVVFAERTAAGSLRHPSFLGLREDKAADQVTADVAVESAAAIPEVTLSNPDRVFWAKTGTTKQDLADYYTWIAPRMLPYVANRPVSMVRCPGGVDARPSGQVHPGAQACFFHKHPGQSFPATLERITIEESKGPAEYLMITAADSLVSLAQMGVLEVHTWGCRWPDIENPDVIVFDLDPDEGVEWEGIADAARLVRDVLDGLGLTSFVKTTGGKGLHVTVPIVPERGWDEVKGFAKAVADAIAQCDPDHYIATMSKAKRTGKVFIDYLRNGRTATFIAPYSTRARERPTVAVPIRWDELDGEIRPNTFDVGNLAERIEKLEGDPWEGYFELEQHLTDDIMREMGLG